MVMWVDSGEEQYAYVRDNEHLDTPPLYAYEEGYHDPILKDQTEDWWRLFGHDVPAEFILEPKKVPKTEIENAGDAGKKEDGVGSEYRSWYSHSERTTEAGGQWDVAAYFTPYHTPATESCPKTASMSFDSKESAEEDGTERNECKDMIATTGAVDRVVRTCRGRDDWDCDFCGLECFCWTVKAEAECAVGNM
jgi:hypothetical protein